MITIAPYGQAIAFRNEDFQNTPPYNEVLLQQMVSQALDLINDPIIVYRSSSIWNRRIHDYLLATTPVQVRYHVR